MNNNQAKILLTIYLGGRLATPIARKVNHHQKRRVLSSPFERANLQTGGYDTPKGHVKIVVPHEDARYSECTQKTTLSQGTYDLFTNPEVLPSFIRGKNALASWASLSDLERLKVNLDRFCEGKEYSFELFES